MNFSQQFEEYLLSFQQRLKRLVSARGVAVMAAIALLVTVVAVALAIRSGFPPHVMLAARVVLLVSLSAIGCYFFIVLRRQVDSNVATEIEARTHQFAGRVEAYTDTVDAGNPMRELLAEESLAIAAQYPPHDQVAPKDFTIAWSSAGAAIAAIVLLAVAGPANYSYGVRDLWVGWALPGLLPPQSIEVSPGDDGIRLGGTIRVTANMQGFEPGEAYVHASFADGEWQQVPMSRRDGAFEFTFFSVRQPLQYYVSAANVRSPAFEVHVVDLPNIENLSLTYHFPEWTGRDAELHDPGGDVRAIVDTQVELRITTDRPMTPGELVLDEGAIGLETDGMSATARFTVTTDGQYYVAAKVGGERIRLTDDYFISVKEDAAPDIQFSRPGRDWSASRIEEVTTRVTADDDFSVDALELRFSVNGGDWQSLPLTATGNDIEVDHVFFLESLSQDTDNASLEPGDLISYYAVAEDRSSSTRTDMFFIDVQDFDRRYSQSQQSGGMAGQQGNQQTEVSQRQREIIVSTWNLIREQNEQRRANDAYINDNSALLSRLQQTLREQVETLAERSEARQLTSTDQQIALFVEHLRKAAAAMSPAAERLAEIALDDALLPEQEALQHLLAAEAVFTDINVSLQANNRGGGGGGQAGRDLSEMFELEMDLEKNQYETGSTATPAPPQRQFETAADELAELARRQEQLSRNQSRAQTPTPEQRWQQEMLRRDVEKLQQRLEELASRSADSSPQPGGAANDGSTSSDPSASQSGEISAQDIDELRRRLASATRAMDDADRAMQEQSDPESLQRAMDEAGRQLQGARDSAASTQLRAMQAAVSELADRAEKLHEAQTGLDERLQEGVRRYLDDLGDGDEENSDFNSGLTFTEETQIADGKRKLLGELQDLQQDARRAARDAEEDQPRSAEEILDALQELQETEIESRIAVAAAYIEQGQAVYIASSESAVTEGLRALRNDLRRAESMLTDAANGQPGDTTGSQLDAALQNTRELRRGLQRMAASGQQIERPRSTGIAVDDLDYRAAIQRDAEEISSDVSALLAALANSGATPQDLDELRRLAAGIRASDFSGNPELLAREARTTLSLVEQLELALARTATDKDHTIRSNVDEQIPEQHRKLIADYYRKLGESDD